MAKTAYNWNKVEAGDIISFRYKGKKSTSALLNNFSFKSKVKKSNI